MKLSIKTRHIILNTILVVCTLYIVIVPVMNVTSLSPWPRILKAVPAICFIVFVWHVKRGKIDDND